MYRRDALLSQLTDHDSFSSSGREREKVKYAQPQLPVKLESTLQNQTH